MSRHDLSEVDLREGALRIRLRRATRGKPAASPIEVSTSGQPSGAAPTAASAPAAPEKPAKATVPIKSPTPGTFYRAAGPDSKAFVEVGTRVTPTTVVCIIEAMKIFNEINAECTGVITEILVENQQPVEYGQVLFKVDPTG
jgi:acetyl-CoA carboxylase biotin carboxyl carrier protein